MSEQNKTVVRRVIDEIVNQGNVDLISELVSPQYSYFEPTVGSLRGHEGYNQIVAIYRTAFPDMTLTIDEQIAEGDKVVTRFTAEGTHHGELLGVAPTGKHVSVQGVVISRIEDGQIVEDFETFDVHGMLRQLDAVRAAAA
jgi:steroid delta-isomerase-like uncharacterized protein